MLAKTRHRLYILGLLFYKRAFKVVLFAALFAIIGNQGYTLVDKYHYNHAADSDFIDYYSFDVNNARAGEDVYFQVCRKHDQNYKYEGTLQVSVLRNADDQASTAAQVYSQPIGGTLNAGECENKVLRASTFVHTPGNYVMRFNVEIKVKYGYVKRGFKESNVYTIYPQPADVQQQIQYYQNIINNLQAQPTSPTSSQRSQPDSLKVPSGQTTPQSSTDTQPVVTPMIVGQPSPTNMTTNPTSPVLTCLPGLPLLGRLCL